MTTMFQRLPRTGVEWLRNPRGRYHAYVVGPGQGDAPLCGRTVLSGVAEAGYVGPRCTYCMTVLREEAAQAAA